MFCGKLPPILAQQVHSGSGQPFKDPATGGLRPLATCPYYSILTGARRTHLSHLDLQICCGSATATTGPEALKACCQRPAARHSLGQHGLAVARRPKQQHSPGRAWASGRGIFRLPCDTLGIRVTSQKHQQSRFPLKSRGPTLQGRQGLDKPPRFRFVGGLINLEPSNLLSFYLWFLSQSIELENLFGPCLGPNRTLSGNSSF